MTEKKPLRKGQGRRQIIACQGRIRDLIALGYDVRMVYDALCEEGLITVSYAGFYDFVTQRKRVKRDKVQLLIADTDPTPLFPAAPIIQPVLPSGQPANTPLYSAPNDMQVTPSGTPQVAATASNVPRKPPPLLPVQPSGQSASTTEQRRQAMQERLNNSVRANTEGYLNSVNSDPALQKELDRLRGEE